MKTKTIEIDGEMKEVEVYENIFEYLNGATFLDENEYYTSDEKYFIEEFDIDEFLLNRVDLTFIQDGKDDYQYFNIDGKEYTYINWGENEISLIPNQNSYGYGYIIYEKVNEDEYRALHEYIYETEEEAEEELLKQDIAYIYGEYRNFKKYENFGEYCEAQDCRTDWAFNELDFEDAKYAITPMNIQDIDTSHTTFGYVDYDEEVEIDGEKYVVVDSFEESDEIILINIDGINKNAYLLFELKNLNACGFNFPDGVFETVGRAIQQIKEYEDFDNVKVGIRYNRAPEGDSDIFNLCKVKFKNIKIEGE